MENPVTIVLRHKNERSRQIRSHEWHGAGKKLLDLRRISARRKEVSRKVAEHVTGHRARNQPPAAPDDSGEKPWGETAQEQQGADKVRHQVCPGDSDETDT